MRTPLAGESLRMKIFLILTFLFLSVSIASAEPRPALKVMPTPSSLQLGNGWLTIDRSFSVAMTGTKDDVLGRGVQRLLDQLSRETGMLLVPRSGRAEHATLVIQVDHGSEKIQKLGEDESYDLAVTPAGAKLKASNPLGALHALETFLQLVETTDQGFAVPAVTIHDQPRFPWRGLLIDVARHFIPIDVLKRNLDAMAAVKMNVLHWHLYDNEGFRIESKKFPKLHEMGSDGMFYTQAEIRDLVAYAHDRGIRIVPEFEMPGHSRSIFVGYPELASAPGPYQIEPSGESDAAMDPTKDETYKFIDKFIDEMTKLFPDAYFHIGGDEVNGKAWDSNPKIQAFIRAHSMKSNQDLQAYFNQRVQKILRKHHKNMIGWDEVLHPDLPKTVVVQSWRGQQSLAGAAKQGYSGLLSFGYYLDLMWPAARHYAVDPMSAAATLNDEEKKRILGGEACMWSEFVSPENIDNRIWPRNAAVAERLWSPAEVRDPASMYERLDRLSTRLEWLGMTHRSAKYPMLRRMSGGEDTSPLLMLAQIVEPVKDYTRGDAIKGTWDFRAPLNHLVDAVDPESEPARKFRDLIAAYIQSNYRDASTETEIRAKLTAWRDNDAKLRPTLQKSFLLQEITPLSENLSTISATALLALDYLDKSEPTPEAWRTQQLAALERAKTPQANLLLMVVDPIEQLIQASAKLQKP
jgi:hexosaminidase